MRRAALTLLLLAACGPGPKDPALAGPTFTVGALTFRVGSTGVVKEAGLLTFWLTSSPATCTDIFAAPVATTTFFSLAIEPPASGATSATVVPTKSFPAEGEALGRLERRTGGALDARVDAASGSVTWSVDAAGTLTLETLDVGFVGTTDRMVGGGLRLTACN